MKAKKEWRGKKHGGLRPSFNGDSMSCFTVHLLLSRPKKSYNSSTSTPKHQRQTRHLHQDCTVNTKLTNTSGSYTVGFWNSGLHPTKMDCSVMIIIDKDPNKELLFEPNAGSNLGHPVGFLFCPEFLPPRIHPTTRWLDYKSNHTMVPSHSGFFLFYHNNLQGSCLRTVIQPLVETAGLLISWVFPFLPPTIPTSTDQQGGVSFQTTPMGKITHSQSTDWGWVLNDIPTGPNLCL